LENITEFLKNAAILNHINFSGMGIPQQELTALCSNMNECPMLIGIHLDNNGIMDDQQFMHDILDLFGLGREDIPFRLRCDDHSQTKQPAFNKRASSHMIFYQQVDSQELQSLQEVRYADSIQKYMGINKPDDPKSKSSIDEDPFDAEFCHQRTKLKNNIFLQKQIKIVRKDR